MAITRIIFTDRENRFLCVFITYFHKYLWCILVLTLSLCLIHKKLQSKDVLVTNMPNMSESMLSNGAILSIEVYSFDSKPLIQVSVEAKKDSAIYKATYNTLSGRYEFKNLERGIYELSITAEGYETQKKSISINQIPLSEMIILGKTGMQFYYRGAIKVPFEPNFTTFGVVIGGDSVKNTIQEIERKFEIKVSGFYKTDVYLFKYPADVPNELKDKFRNEIKQNIKGVRLVSPILRQTGKSVTLLNDEIIVKFKSDISEKAIEKLIEENGLEVLRQIPYVARGYQLKAKSGNGYQMLDLCKQLYESNLVEYAEPNLFSTAVYD